MNIAVCEDLKHEGDVLCIFIEKYFKERSCPIKITAFKSGDAFLGSFKPFVYEIVFLDIYMPGINGVDTARKIRETDRNVIIIFTTSSKDHALDGYAVDAMQYLLKPIEYKKLSTVLDKCHDRFADAMRFIEVLSDRVLVKILLRDILYVEVFDKTCIVHTHTGNIKTYSTLGEIEQLLGGLPFLRCHRTHIVNMAYIIEVLDDEFMLQNGERILIRRSDKLAIKQIYTDYVFSIVRGKANV